MVYKKYVTRDGKRHGPYYYTTVRDKEGKVKTVYLGSDLSKIKKQQANVVQRNQRSKTPKSTSPQLKYMAIPVAVLFIFAILVFSLSLSEPTAFDSLMPGKLISGFTTFGEEGFDPETPIMDSGTILPVEANETESHPPAPETPPASIPKTSGDADSITALIDDLLALPEQEVPAEELAPEAPAEEPVGPSLMMTAEESAYLPPLPAGIDEVPPNGSDPYYINENTILRHDTYNINVTSLPTAQAALWINASDIYLDCNGSTIMGNGTGYGVYINSSFSNVVIRNCILYNYSYGIFAESNNYHLIANNTVDSNANQGIYLYNSNYSNVTNCTAINNSERSLQFTYSYFANATNINLTTIYSAQQLYFEGSHNCSVFNATVTGGTDVIFLSGSTNNTFSNITTSGGNYGFYLVGSSNNTIKNSYILNQGDYGIYVMDSNSMDNLFYNNYLASNAAGAWDAGTNDWNTSEQTGPNIIGGDDIGGNYYDNYTGYDLDGDGIGDTLDYPIPEFGLNIDYLPLTNNVTPCVNLTNGTSPYYVNESTTLCEGQSVNINVSNNQGALWFNASNIYLDCNGSTIFGNNSSAGFGVWINQSFENITVKNCVLLYYDFGIIAQSNHHNITNNTVMDSPSYGMYLENSNISNITNNTLIRSGMYGFYITSSSSTNVIEGNNISNNTLDGIHINGDSDWNNLTKNLISYNGNDGIYVSQWFYTASQSFYTTISNNTVSFNSLTGIYLGQVSDPTSLSFLVVRNNTVINNSQYGIFLDYIVQTTLANNTIQENAVADLAINANSDAICKHLVENNTGSSGGQIWFNNTSVNIQNVELSELILCNADYSTVTNVNVSGSDTLYNNYIFTARAASLAFSNVNSSYNYHGIFSSSGNSNNLSNLTLLNNSNIGLYITGNSFIVNNSNISGNTINGLYINNSKTGNLIYNNYLANTNNTWDDGTNDWNTSEQTGPNIIGGVDIGGNYYSNYTGTDSDGDGIGDTLDYYIPGGSNIDYLPLTNNVIPCVNLINGTTPYYVNSNTTLCEGQSVNINASGGESALWINASDIYLDCNGSVIFGDNASAPNAASGIYVNGSFSNITIRNCVVHSYSSGVYLNMTEDNTLQNNTVYYAYAGFRLIAANRSNLTNNNATLNQLGFYLSGSSSNNTLSNNNANFNNVAPSGWGFFVGSGSNENNLTNNNASSNLITGFYIYSNNNNVLNNNASSNTNYGVQLLAVQGNNISDNTLQENAIYDLVLSINIPTHCQNYISGNTGSGGRPIWFNNTSITVQDVELSELILCNADNSILLNVNISGSATLNNNNIDASFVDNSNFTNVNSSGNYRGIEMYHSTFNNISGGNFSNNLWGIYLWNTNNTTVFNNNVSDNTQAGIKLSNEATDNTIYNNYFNNTKNTYDSGTNDWNTTQQTGPNIIGGVDIGGNFYSNYTGTDDDGDGIGDILDYYIPGGSNIDYLPITNEITSCVNLTNGTTPYYVNSNTTLCAGQSVNTNVSNGEGAFTISANSIYLDCNGSTIFGNGSGNGILLSGVYTEVIIRNCILHDYNYSAYISASSSNSFYNNTFYNSTLDNVYIEGLSGSNNFTNNTLHSGGQRGIMLSSVMDGNMFYDNLIYNHTSTGIVIGSGTDNNIVSGNNVSENSGNGIQVQGSSNTIGNNYVASNSIHGFNISSPGSYNILSNNTAFNNSQVGFYISSSNFNNLTNNTIYNNLDYGIYVESANTINISNCTFWNNTDDTYTYATEGETWFQSSTSITFWNNTVIDTHNTGVYYNSSNDSIVAFNTFSSNDGTPSAISARETDNVTIHNNTFVNFTGGGVYNIVTQISTNINVSQNNFSSSRWAVDYRQTNDSYIENNLFYTNSLVGIMVRNAANNITIRYNTFYDNLTNFGIVLINTTNNDVYNNTLETNNGLDIYDEAHGNLIHDNMVKFSSYGFWFELTDASYTNQNNTIYNNTFYDGISCFYADLLRGSGNIFENNTLTNCSYAVRANNMTNGSAVRIRWNNITQTNISVFYAQAGSELIVYDMNIDSSNNMSAISQTASTIHLVNMTLNRSTTNITDTSNITAKWYSVVRVYDADSSANLSASVTSTASDSSIEWTATSASATGRTTNSWPYNLDTEYVEYQPGNLSNISNISTHVFSASATGYTAGTTTNSTLSNEIATYDIALSVTPNGTSPPSGGGGGSSSVFVPLPRLKIEPSNIENGKFTVYVENIGNVDLEGIKLKLSDLPSRVQAKFSPNLLDLKVGEGDEFEVMLDGTENLPGGSYDINVRVNDIENQASATAMVTFAIEGMQKPKKPVEIPPILMNIIKKLFDPRILVLAAIITSLIVLFMAYPVEKLNLPKAIRKIFKFRLVKKKIPVPIGTVLDSEKMRLARYISYEVKGGKKVPEILESLETDGWKKKDLDTVVGYLEENDFELEEVGKKKK
ncbi:MAG: NosD domain-containing protein [archaeon]